MGVAISSEPTRFNAVAAGIGYTDQDVHDYSHEVELEVIEETTGAKHQHAEDVETATRVFENMRLMIASFHIVDGFAGCWRLVVNGDGVFLIHHVHTMQVQVTKGCFCVSVGEGDLWTDDSVFFTGIVRSYLYAAVDKNRRSK